MLNTFCCKSSVNSMHKMHKLLLENSKCLKVLSNIKGSKFYTSCYCSTYFLNDKYTNESTLHMPPSCFTISRNNFHTDVSLSSVPALDLKKASDAFFKIDMNHLKEAPVPAFWLGIIGLMPTISPFFSQMLFGYSHGLVSMQCLYCATILSCMGGVKWGTLLNDKSAGTWENYGLSGLPSGIAIVALCLPKVLGLLILIFGFLAAFVIDLTTSNYPRWFLALRGVLTNVSVVFLFISMIQTLIH